MGSTRQALAAVAIMLVGLFGAATLGYAAYLVSRDSVGLPVTKLDTPPQNLAPARKAPAEPKPKARTVVTPPPPPAATTVESSDDHGGSRGGSGGGHGGDD